MAKRKAKNTKKEIASARKTRALKARHIAYICAEINSKRLPNGRLRRGELEKALKEHKPIIPWITIDLITKGLKKDLRGSNTTITTTISDLTDFTASSPDTDISPTKDKTELVLKNQRCCWANARVETYEIIVIVNAAWAKSFARVDRNKKAIASRGWNPLTRNLLDHPEIAETQEIAHQENQENSQETVASTLNFGTGVANKVMVDILQNIDRENVRSQILQNQEQGRQAIETLTQCKKLSAGAVSSRGGRCWVLTSCELLYKEG